MKRLAAIDWWIIEKIEKFAHWFQKWTGKTNYWVAGKIYLIVVYILMAQLMNYYLKNPPTFMSWLGARIPDHFGAFLCYFLIVVFLIEGTFIWKILEKDAYQRLQMGLANPRKASLRLVYFREIMLFITVFVVFLIREMDLYLYLVLLIYYLEACDPLPPCDAKIKELFKFHARKEATVHAN